MVKGNWLVLESLFLPDSRKRLSGILKGLQKKMFPEVTYLMNQQVKDLKEKRGIEVQLDAPKLQALMLLHIKGLLNRCKIFHNDVHEK